MSELKTRAGEGWVRFDVRVAPRASRTALCGVQEGALRISLTAPPTDGAANAALVALVAKTLRVPKRAVRIVRGERSRHKTLEVTGVEGDALDALTGSKGRGRS